MILRLTSLLLILITSACVDKIDFNIPGNVSLNLVVNGLISNEPGPYKIQLSSGFDLDNKLRRQAINAKLVALYDNLGTHEVLTQGNTGDYFTNADGIRGTVGNAYTLHIELFDGRVYESIPDTLYGSGTVDSVYSIFQTTYIADTARYGFDIMFDASSHPGHDYFIQWKFTGTFKVDTQPEGDKDGESCSFPDCDKCSICNLVPKCSGSRNIGSPSINIPPGPIFVQMFPCTCCTCWYNIFNDKPMLTSSQLLGAGRFKGVVAGYVPVDVAIFQHKVYAEVSQKSLSRQAYDFYRAIRDQQNATNSLFQPVSGKIPSNFVQLSGNSTPVEGIFYATAISSKSIILTRDDVPKKTFNFPIKDPPIIKVCTKLFPNSTTTKPSFWVD